MWMQFSSSTRAAAPLLCTAEGWPQHIVRLLSTRLFWLKKWADHWQPCRLFAGRLCGAGQSVDQHAALVLPRRVEHSCRSENIYTNKSSTTRPCTSVMRKSRPLCR